MSYSESFPTQRPIFSLDAANAGRLDPRCSFSRSDTPPTYAAPSAVHYWSNEKHLSSENLLLQSSDFDTSWSADNLSDRNSGQADPSGGTDGFELVESTANSWHRVYQSVTATGDITAVVYAKQNSGTRYLMMTMGGGGNNLYECATFDLAGGTPNILHGSSSSFTSVSATQTASGSGYYKCVLKATGTCSSLNVSVTNTTATPAGNPYGLQVYTGDGSSSIDVAFASLSTTGATDYNATTTSIHRQYASSLKSVSYAGQPRFEYDPASDGQSAARGILIESQATNLVTYSSDITQSFFTGFRSTQESNVGIAPDGTLTADLLREDSSSGNSHGVYFEYASGGTTAQTISVYAKAAGRNHLSFRFDPTNGVFGSDFVYFNLSTGAVGTTDSDITASIESCGNGWYRCIATRTALASANGRIVLYLADADNSTSYDGDSYSGVLLWGIQAEANSSHASSMVSTSGSAATRAAESLSVATADIGYTGGPVSMQVDFNANVVLGKTHRIAGIENTLGVMRPYISAGGDVKMFGDVGGTTVIDTSIKTDITTNTDYSVAFRWDTNDYRGALGGTLGNADTSCPLPDFETATLYVGTQSSSGFELDGHVKRVALYGEALSDTNLQALTS